MRHLIAGAAGHAQEVAWSLREQAAARGERCELLFFDDGIAPGPLVSGLGRVVGDLDRLRREAGPGTCLVLGIGLPQTKRAVVERLGGLGVPWATVVHPGATVGPNVELGEGSYVAAGAILTVNVRVGRFATVNMHCQVAHDATVGDFATLHPDTHLAGGVSIGDGAELGTSSVVIPGLSIGARAVLGAGAVAVRSLPGDATYVGVPARRLHGAARSPAERGGDSLSMTAASPGARRTWTNVPP